MKRILLGIFFFALFCVAKSAAVDAVEAATVSGTLDNRSGSITVNVNLTIRNESGGVVWNNTYPLLAGQTHSILQSVTTGDFPTISWDNGSCGDVGSTTTTGAGGVYQFAQVQDVHCTETNASVTISATSCTGSTGRVDFRVNPNADGNPNIDKFELSRSQVNNPNSYLTPVTINYVDGQFSYPNNLFSSLASGTYYVKLVAYANAPDGSSTTSDSSSFVCGDPITPPTNLYSSVYCVSGNSRADLNWTLATGTTFSYQYVQWGTSSGTYPNNVFALNTTTSTTLTSLSGIVYYWRVAAYSTSGTWYYSTPSSFNGIGVCTAAGATNLTQTLCISNNADSVTFGWTRGTPTASITQEVLEITQDDPNFNPANIITPPTTSVTGLATKNVIYTFVDGARYYWRINTRFTDNIWRPSGASFVVAPSSCSSPSVGNCQNLSSFTWIGASDRTISPSSTTATFTLQYFQSSVGEGRWNHNLAAGPGVSVSPVAGNYSAGFGGGTFSKSVVATLVDPSLATSQVIPFTVCGQSAILRISMTTNITNPDTLRLNPGPYCYGSGGSASPRVTFQWRDMSNNEDKFYLDISGDAFTSEVWGYKEIISDATTKPGTGMRTFVWDADAGSSLTGGDVDGSTPLTPDRIPQQGKTYYWRVRAFASPASYSQHIYSFSGNTVTSVTVTNGGTGYTQTPTVTISGTPGFGAVATATLNGDKVSYVTVSSGGINYPSTTTVAFTNGGSGSSEAQAKVTLGTVVGTSNVPGNSGFTVPSCFKKHDLSLQSDGTADRPGLVRLTNSQGAETTSFSPGEEVTAEIRVKNLNYSGIEATTSTTKLNFYYKGAAGQTLPNCATGSGQSGIPIDGTATTADDGDLSQVIDPLGVGATQSRTFTFNVGQSEGRFDAISYVIPTCFLDDPTSGYDVAWGNNTTVGIGYTVGVGKYFVSEGGDVGAVGRVSAGVDSTDANRVVDCPLNGCVVEYQSQYMIAAGDLPDSGNTYANFSSSTGFAMEGVGEDLANGRIYAGISDKFRSLAAPWSECSDGIVEGNAVTTYGDGEPTNGRDYTVNGLLYCPGNTTIDGEIDITGKAVIFVDGDLELRGNIYATGANGIVFVVKDNIFANIIFNGASTKITTRLDGIYITQKTFYDSGEQIVGGSGVIYGLYDGFGSGTLTQRLKVRGAVYADGLEGPGFGLSRHFDDADGNKAYPSDQFIFDPKYLILLQDLLATKPVGWQEAAP